MIATTESLEHVLFLHRYCILLGPQTWDSGALVMLRSNHPQSGWPWPVIQPGLLRAPLKIIKVVWYIYHTLPKVNLLKNSWRIGEWYFLLTMTFSTAMFDWMALLIIYVFHSVQLVIDNLYWQSFKNSQFCFFRTYYCGWTPAPPKGWLKAHRMGCLPPNKPPFSTGAGFLSIHSMSSSPKKWIHQKNHLWTSAYNGTNHLSKDSLHSDMKIMRSPLNFKHIQENPRKMPWNSHEFHRS